MAGNAALDRKAKKEKTGDSRTDDPRHRKGHHHEPVQDNGHHHQPDTGPAETQEAADLRNQAWEQAANGIDDETTRRIWQQVDTVTAHEAERLRAQVRKLIGLLNAGRPALDENGYPMWDHLIALSNRQCWQWEIAAAHSGCLAAIMQAAGIDDWPPADSMPDITNPVITINLSTNQ